MYFRQLAEAGDYPPQIIAEWTFYQCRMMAASEEEITGKRKIPGEVAKVAGLLGRRVRPKKVLKAFARGRASR